MFSDSQYSANAMTVHVYRLLSIYNADEEDTLYMLCYHVFVYKL